jgi:D-amino-acid dehydrogenase
VGLTGVSDDAQDALPALSSSSTAQDIVVIGAGVVGLSIALALQRRGRRVLVIDREGIAAGASRGNAGAFAYSDVLPLASPGLLAKLPRWLLDPLGPLALRPAYLPRIAPWLWRFWRACREENVAASTQAQAALMKLSAAATLRLIGSLQADALLHRNGNLHLYDSDASWRASLPGWQLRAQHGIAFEHLQGRDALATLQPGLDARFTVGTFVADWPTIDDPLVWVRRLADALRQAGGALARARAVALKPRDGGAAVELADGTSLQARHVIIAAGAWSHRLTATLGEPLPLETERGYNTTLPPGAFDLRRQLTFVDHGFVMTPIAGGVRVGGAVELAGLDAPPNFARADALLAKAQRFVPALRSAGGTRWMGCRPSLPDSLPVIDRSAATPAVLYAFGHGHLGLTQSAVTAELIAALVHDEPPPIDLQPFSARRF